MLEKLLGRQDREALVPLERQQIVVTCDDGPGLRRTSAAAQEVITIPAVWLYETGVSYSTKLFGRRTDLRLNVINLLDKKYVTTGPFLGDPRT